MDGEIERYVIFAVSNNYQIVCCRDAPDFVFIKAQRLLIYNKNGQQMVNSIIKKLANCDKT